MVRGDGATTRQMESAPKSAIFIWCNGDLAYPIALARKIGREDLQIKSLTWLDGGWRGLKVTGIVIDHAAYLTGKQYDLLQNALTSVGRS